MSRAAERSALASVRECSFYARCVRKTDNMKKTNGTMSNTRRARPAVLLPCLPRSSCLPYAPSSSCTRHARHTRIACALPCIACITRQAACCVSCMPFPTARQENAEKRHEVAKCQRFGAVNRPQIIEIMFSCLASCCVSVRNVLIDWKIVKWLDKRPF